MRNKKIDVNTFDALEGIETLFKNHQIKITKQRKMIYSYLVMCNYPVTADVIYADLRLKAQTDMAEDCMNLSTIYRILDVFTKKKLIKKNIIGVEQCAAYEIISHEHKHHLICIKCNKITTLEGCPLSGYDRLIKETTHFQVIEHKLEILGICPDCQRD